MEQIPQTPPRTPVILAETQNTPPALNQGVDYKQSRSPVSSFGKTGKTGTPDRLKVPKAAFKYPERYTSPTDQMVSPVTRGILARSKKASKLLPPSANLPKIEAQKFQDLNLVQIDNS